eukprot:TRINITY_DN26662_c0_g1_i1.p1 TRINITY_DN26662_c0_g1~~TRINITY_DN26662_c0_g1_i1.p1  ORF type:complete len:379 (-),score=77.79 TRINITY_DN26662_c0_g1_i1:33-1169(-)
MSDYWTSVANMAQCVGEVLGLANPEDVEDVDKGATAAASAAVAGEKCDAASPQSCCSGVGEGELVVSLLDDGSGCRRTLEVNATAGTAFENEAFVGEVLVLHRPDPAPTSGGWPYEEHFRGKLRRVEFRLQGTFKVEPGETYFAMELNGAFTLGTALRVTASWVMSIVSMLTAARGASLHYNLEREESDGEVVRPFVAFPLLAGEGFCITPQGEQPPPITETIDPSSYEERANLRLNTSDTFTFAHWSKQVDLQSWEIKDLPFGWRSSLVPFIGRQPVELSVYSLLRPTSEGGRHCESNKRRLLHLEVTHGSATAVSASPIQRRYSWRSASGARHPDQEANRSRFWCGPLSCFEFAFLSRLFHPRPALPPGDAAERCS